ncbi:hypothetical protein HanRHA438_Chr01g0006971 [Helianthus annuus]|nr:hypothetical protein HanRHA438_Chr01g0006971 [Helianthus annuus]
MLNYSWRKIYLEPPVGYDWDSLAFEFEYDFYNNACVNSVVHLMLIDTHDILGFDLRTEKFMIINTPQGVKPHEFDNYVYVPFIIKVNGCIGVACPVLEKMKSISGHYKTMNIVFGSKKPLRFPSLGSN